MRNRASEWIDETLNTEIIAGSPSRACAPIGFLCADLERTIYAQEKPKEAERDAGLQLIWFNKPTPPKMWQLYT